MLISSIIKERKRKGVLNMLNLEINFGSAECSNSLVVVG